MSTLPNESEHDDQLVRYVLGLLPDKDAERFDEASIADDEMAWQLRVIENDLIDSYIRGTMPPERLERFESWYLASPRRQENVRFARAFLHAIDRAAAKTAAADETPAPVSSAPHRDESPPATAGRSAAPSTLVWLLPAAAGLLVVTGTLMFETAGRRSVSAPARVEVAASPAPRVADQRQPDRDVPPSVAAKAPTHAPAPRAQTTALVLFPQTRAIASIPSLVVPPDADSVTFQLRLESREFSRYQAGLQDPSTDQVVWRSSWMAVKASAAEPSSISITVPARLLKAQHYAFELAGRLDGAAEVVGSYTFQVLPR